MTARPTGAGPTSDVPSPRSGEIEACWRPLARSPCQRLYLCLCLSLSLSLCWGLRGRRQPDDVPKRKVSTLAQLEHSKPGLIRRFACVATSLEVVPRCRLAAQIEASPGKALHRGSSGALLGERRFIARRGARSNRLSWRQCHTGGLPAHTCARGRRVEWNQLNRAGRPAFGRQVLAGPSVALAVGPGGPSGPLRPSRGGRGEPQCSRPLGPTTALPAPAARRLGEMMKRNAAARCSDSGPAANPIQLRAVPGRDTPGRGTGSPREARPAHYAPSYAGASRLQAFHQLGSPGAAQAVGPVKTAAPRRDLPGWARRRVTCVALNVVRGTTINKMAEHDKRNQRKVTPVDNGNKSAVSGSTRAIDCRSISGAGRWLCKPISGTR